VGTREFDLAFRKIAGYKTISVLLITEGAAGAYFVLSGGASDETGRLLYEAVALFLVALVFGAAALTIRQALVPATVFFFGFTGLLGWIAYEIWRNPDHLGFYLIVALPLSFVVAINSIVFLYFMFGLFARRPNPGA